jgi:hypothetical protein
MNNKPIAFFNSAARRAFVFCLLAIVTIAIPAASVFFQPALGQSSGGVWRFIDESEISAGQRVIFPQVYRTVRLDQTALSNLLAQAPKEFTPSARDDSVILTLPMPDGTLAAFRIEDSPVMEEELAAKFPEIKSYRGQGIDDPTSTTRFDSTPDGFHAIVLTENGTVYIDPYSRGDAENYITYYKRDYRREGEPFQCYFSEANAESQEDRASFSPAVSNGTMLRTYRLACAATGEYTQFFGGTVAQGLAAINTTMNRVNGIYEREVAARMVLVANNNLIVYTNSSTDPYTNNDGGTMLGQNQSNLDSVIGSANYDIGHVFSTGGGGIAGLGVVCSNGNKARGVTGLPAPTGDPFAVDYVAHEMGHQFGARHTFNGTASSCSGNRSSVAAYEPGSGSTIMAYAGICGSQNLQSNSDDYFHVRSLQEIIAFISGSSGACAISTATGNTLPVVSAPASFVIPKGTPFTLVASGSDADPDSLTYCWEEYDLGAASPPDTDSDGQARPILRSFLPKSQPSRTFPKLSDILNNISSFGESLPTISRSMTFQVTARDNRAGGGGVATATTTVTIDGGSGPFVVTQPDTSITWAVGTPQTVMWNVAGTSSGLVNAANVRISLSTDGGNTFPIELAASTPNDGSHTVTAPNNLTTSARVKVEAVGNIFFDISNANFTILDTGSCSYSINPTSQNFNPGGGSSSLNVTAPSGCGWTATSNDSFITISSGSMGSGNGVVNYSVSPNTTASPRTGTMTIAGLTFTVNQTPCSYSINPASETFAFSGGTSSVNVTATSGCPWTAVSNASFITITSGAAGTGNGAVNYTVSANPTTTPRTGTMTIAGQTFTVTQSGAPVCSFAISPSSNVVEATGGSGSVSVTTQAGCGWSAVSNASFITITSGAAGTGNGTVNYTVGVNTTSSIRTGTMTIAGQTLTITQAGASCVSSITPSSRSLTSGSQSSTVSVSAASSCNWTAQSQAGWITITSGGAGPGPKTLKYAVAANPSTSPRSGAIIIGSKVHTVIQAGIPCSYSISPSGQNFTTSGGGGTVNVTATAGCGWTAVSNVGWAVITSGGSGSGSGVVNYTVGANSGGTRSGTLTIAGQSFTLIQEGVSGGCSYTIAPTSQSYTSSGGSGNVTVTTQAGCQWTAVSNESWVTITTGSSGSGSGAVSYTVAVNPDPGSRSGTMTIAGQTFTVTEGGNCTYAINPGNRTMGKSGGSASVSVTAPGGCGWTAVSNAGWITVTTGSSGSGNGTVNYTVSVNTTGTTRTGTVTIAGKTHTVKQSAF